MSITVYTVEELEPILRMSERTIRKYLNYGWLKGEIIGKRWLITEDAVNELLHAPDVTQRDTRSANPATLKNLT